MMQAPVVSRTVAFFDFDQTLVQQDTLPLFLRTVSGEDGFKSALKAGIVAAMMNPFAWRNAGRAAIFRSVLHLVPLAEAQDIARSLAHQLRWKEPLREALQRHADAGDTVVVATGSLSLYMPIFLQHGACPIDHLLATEMEHHNGVLSGALATPSCTRAGKVRRIKEFMKEHGPFDRIIAYGNLPDDRGMLRMAHQGFVIDKHPQNDQTKPFA